MRISLSSAGRHRKVCQIPLTSFPVTNVEEEFNEHQRDVFCVFSGVGVSRLRNYLNADTTHRRVPLYDDGTMFDDDDGAEPEMIVNVTAQAHGMGIDDMDEDFGEGSEMLGG